MSKESFREFLEKNHGKPVDFFEFMKALTDGEFKSSKKKDKAKIDFRKFHLDQEEDDDVIHLKYGEYYVMGFTEEGRAVRGTNLPEEFDTDDEGCIKVK